MNDAKPHIMPVSSIQYFDVVVIGSGISGLVSASILSRKGDRVAVVDDYDHVGGNHIDWSSPEGYTFDIGSLIFQDDSPLLRHFPELLAHYIPINPSWGRLNPQGKITDYPISIRDDIVGAGPIGLLRIFGSVLYARLFCRRLDSARDFARFWVGGYLLHRSGLETYMRRFYGISPDKVDLELARKRMLWIAEYASLTNLIRLVFKRRKSKGRKNRQMARPKEGYAALYQPAVETLQNAGVAFKLSASMKSIRKSPFGFELCLADGTIASNRIISTVPIEVAEKLCGISPSCSLTTITLISLYFSFSGDRGFERPIIYNFSHEGSWKRLTVYSDFYGRVMDREYFAVEVIAGTVASTEQAEADFRRHVASNRMFRGDLKLEGSQTLTNAYPIYSKGAADDAADAIVRLRDFGIESLGRQGAFNYQPTARVSTIDVETAIGKH